MSTFIMAPPAGPVPSNEKPGVIAFQRFMVATSRSFGVAAKLLDPEFCEAMSWIIFFVEMSSLKTFDPMPRQYILAFGPATLAAVTMDATVDAATSELPSLSRTMIFPDCSKFSAKAVENAPVRLAPMVGYNASTKPLAADKSCRRARVKPSFHDALAVEKDMTLNLSSVPRLRSSKSRARLDISDLSGVMVSPK